MKKIFAICSALLVVLAGLYFLSPSERLDDAGSNQVADSFQSDAVEVRLAAPRTPSSVAASEDVSLLSADEREQFAQIQSIQEELLITENLPMAEPEEESTREGEEQ